MGGVAGPALGLGCFLAMAPAEAGSAWLDADFIRDRFRFAGRALASQAQFRQVVGATVPASGQLGPQSIGLPAWNSTSEP